MVIIKQKNRKQMHNKQRGFVLVLALVLLTVMTLIGVSSMNNANMELRATANMRQHQIAFNDVYSVLEYTVSGGALTTAGTPINYRTSNAALQTVISPTANNSSQSTIAYTGCSTGVGSSMVAGKGIRYNFYSNVASDSNAASVVASQQGRGVRSPVAGCP